MGLPRIDKATGTVDSSNKIFVVPNPYVAGTLVAIINGRQLDPALDNGWTESDPASGEFTFKIAPRSAGPIADDPGDLVTAYYENALEPAGGGSDGGIPKIIATSEIVPEICAVDDMRPCIASTEDESLVPEIVGSAEIVPAICSATDMRPKIVKAEVS